jgi:hypothetical protein
MESKKAIYNLIPQCTKTELIEGTAVVEIKAIIEQSNIRYPLQSQTLVCEVQV